MSVNIMIVDDSLPMRTVIIKTINSCCNRNNCLEIRVYRIYILPKLCFV